MKKLLLLLALISATAFGTAYSNTQTGNASASATWGGAGIPGNGDTVTIITGTTVTVDVPTTWGASGVNGTTAVTTVGSGQLVVGAGVFFTIRGNFSGPSGAGATPLIVMNPGATWQFDSSVAASPMTTKYEITSGIASYVFLQANCTAIARCSVQSNAGGGAGYLDASVNSQSGGIIAAYTDFLRLDHIYPAFQSGGGVPWNVTNSTFNYCGLIQSIFTAGTATVFIHNHNVHTNTQGGLIFYSPFAVGLTGAGVRQLENNVFDTYWGANVGGATWVPDSFAITGNYFGQSVAPSDASGIWTQFQYNLLRESPGGQFAASGDVLDNYVTVDVYAAIHIHNPDTSTQPLTPSYLRNVFDNTYYTFASNTNDGIMLDEGAPGAQTSASLKYNLILPSGNGIGGQQLSDVWGPNTASLDIEHNTMAASITSGCLVMEYESIFLPNGVQHRGILANNICFAVAAQAGTVPFIDTNVENPITDLFAPASINNNVRFNLLAANPSQPGDTNQGNGYWGVWSVTPGSTDLVVDPQFVDPTRNMATFDSAYLHHVASATWVSQSSGHTFNVGDIISDSNSLYYNGALINYRAIASFTKTVGGEPGVSTAWHTYWEFASLNSIRNGVGSNATITDATLGITNASYIVALTAWVKAGFAPENVALHNAATDATDIGAVPYTTPLPPAFTKVFGASSIGLGVTTSLTFTLTNPNADFGLTSVAFTDSLPAGIAVSTPSGLSNTCGGTATATAGSGSVSLSGASISGAASCSLSINVTALTAGTWVNTTGAVTSTQGTGLTATATIIVLPASPPSMSTAFGASSIGPGVTTSLTFTIANGNLTTSLTGVAFTDTLPSGIGLTTPSGLVNTCGGAATAAGTTISLSGASIAQSASCTLTINVQGLQVGTWTNTSGVVTATNATGSGAGSAASLSVTNLVLTPILDTIINIDGSLLNGDIIVINTPFLIGSISIAGSRTVFPVVNGQIDFSLAPTDNSNPSTAYQVQTVSNGQTSIATWSVPTTTTPQTISAIVNNLFAPQTTLALTKLSLAGAQYGYAICDLSGTISWCPPSAVWGAITGTLSNQTDLAAALAAKQGSLGYTPLNAALNLSDLASAATARTNLAVAIGSNVEAWSANLDAFSAKTAPAGAVVGTTDTQTMNGKTLDGVTPATFAFLDATSSIQAQINSKQASLGYAPLNPANNLSDVAAVATARANLGLGTGTLATYTATTSSIVLLPTTAPAGLYSVSYYFWSSPTYGGTGATCSLSFATNNGTYASLPSPASILLTAASDNSSAANNSLAFYVASGQGIKYSVTIPVESPTGNCNVAMSVTAH